MKTIVNKKACKEISIEQLKGNEVVAYKCKSPTSVAKKNYAVLARLHGPICYTHPTTSPDSSYGFIPLGESDTKPRYMSNTWRGAINLASESRELKVFYSFKEMLDAMYNGLF